MIIRIKPIILDAIGWTLLLVGLILWVFLSDTLIPAVVFLVAGAFFSTGIVWRVKKSRRSDGYK